MTSTPYLISLVAAHFICDWLWQTRTDAKAKSHDMEVLIKHVTRVSLGIALVLICFNQTGDRYPFWGIMTNAVIHGLIDWNIWRLYAWVRRADVARAKSAGTEFRYWDDHLFFSTIAVDQFLHLATLIILFA